MHCVELAQVPHLECAVQGWESQHPWVQLHGTNLQDVDTPMNS